MSPPRELRSKFRLRKDTVKSPNELGIVPVKQFLCTFKSRKKTKDSQELGMVPVMRLRLNATKRALVSEPTDFGIDPVN